MSLFWVGMVLGLFIGGAVGIVGFALCRAAASGDSSIQQSLVQEEVRSNRLSGGDDSQTPPPPPPPPPLRAWREGSLREEYICFCGRILPASEGPHWKCACGLEWQNYSTKSSLGGPRK